MTKYEIITICAIILGPILAIQVDKFLQKKRNERLRQEDVFKTLMLTRGAPLSYEHVKCLNQIDLEFGKKKYSSITEKWKEYFDHLCDLSYGIDKMNEWGKKKEDLLTEMLYEMGKKLNYSFDKVQIKRHVYSPKGYQEIEDFNTKMRQIIIELCEGNRPLKIKIDNKSNDA